MSFSVYSTSENFRNKYLQSTTQSEKQRVLLDWIEYGLQNNLVLADSLIQSQKSNISTFSNDTKFEFCIYTLFYDQFTNKENGISISSFNFRKSSAENKLLRAFQVSLFKKNIPPDILKFIREEKDLKRATNKAIVSMALAHYFTQKNNFEKSEKYLLDALKHAKRAKIKLISFAVFKSLSSHYTDRQDYEKAVLYNQKGLDLAVKENRKFYVAYHNHKLGDIQLEINNYIRARKYFNNAISIAKKIGAIHLEGQTLGDIGKSYENTLHTDDAIFYYHKSLIRFYKIDNKEGIGSIHKDLGKSYFNKGALNLAETNFRLSEGYLKEIGNNEELADLRHAQSKLALKKKQFNQAKRLVKEAISLHTSNGNNIQLYDSYLLYSEISAALKEFQKAHYYLEKYTDYQDSINALQTREKLAELSELYEAEQKEKRILEQQKELKEKTDQQLIQKQQFENTQLKNKQIVTVLIFSIVLLISIFLIIYFRSKQEKFKKQQLEIELKQTLLRSQMNPHFIFNSMSIIQSYIYDNDLKNSSKFLVSFSRLIRLILENSAKEFIKLDVEIEILERYLEIQKERFEERFNYEVINRDNLDNSAILIPPMLLQPFIENSLEHGALNKVENGKIRITYKIENDLLIFVIEDNGIGRHAAMKRKEIKNLNQHNSMAIEITNSRIKLLNSKYKKAGFLSIQDLNDNGEQGTKVIIATPFQINE